MKVIGYDLPPSNLPPAVFPDARGRLLDVRALSWLAEEDALGLAWWRTGDLLAAPFATLGYAGLDALPARSLAAFLDARRDQGTTPSLANELGLFLDCLPGYEEPTPSRVLELARRAPHGLVALLAEPDGKSRLAPAVVVDELPDRERYVIHWDASCYGAQVARALSFPVFRARFDADPDAALTDYLREKWAERLRMQEERA